MLSHSITLGRVAAIPIRLHWSWAVIFGLLIVALRPVYAFYACDGAVVCGADVGLAVAMAVLVGVSVLLHELGHALVAGRLAVPVQSITLFAFGGVAEVDHDAPGPGAEFAIAVAGPAVSLLIAAGAGLFAWLAPRADGPLALAALVAGHLAAANAIMGVFNLLPGYPMDGGRVLRATLWYLGDELLPATRATAQIGRACGALLGLGGLAVGVLSRQPVAAVWAALVGLFLFRTASGSYRQAVLQSVLDGVSVGDLMQRRFRTVSRELTLEQFVARYVLGQAETGFAVVEPADDAAEPALIGMMTLRNMRRFTTVQWSLKQVGEAMTPIGQVRTLSPQLPAFDALFLLSESPDGLLPVADGPRLVGILRRRDLAVFIQVQLARRRQ